MQNNHEEFAKRGNLKSHTRNNEKRVHRPDTEQELSSGFYMKSQKIYTSLSNEATTSKKSTDLIATFASEAEANYKTSWTKKNYSSYTEIARTSQQKRRRKDDHLSDDEKERFQERLQYGYIPQNRRWLYTAYSKSHQNDRSFRFKLASYNLLAPDLANEHFYLYQSYKQLVDWHFRKNKILHEITHLDADIYCFQELQEDDFNQWFSQKLAHMGYESCYKKRYGDKPDGCCICFKTNKFRLVKKKLIDYYVPDVPLLSRENVGIVLLLESVEDEFPNKTICVATTHIFFNPKRGDFKLAQLVYLLASMDRVAYKGLGLNGKKAEFYPSILCGDFNFYIQSKLYQFIRSSSFTDYQKFSRQLISGQLETSASEDYIEDCLLPKGFGITDKSQFESENIKRGTFRDNIFGGEHLSHSFCFSSVYKHFNKVRNDFEVTTCLKDAKRTVDYIFYHSELTGDADESKARPEMNLIARLELFHEQQLMNYLLPNRIYPSDHFMIAAKFSIN